MKFIILFLFFIGILLSLNLYFKPFEKEVHYHAGFLLYDEGKTVDLSDMKYMHIESCADEKGAKHEDEQIEKAHLHDGIGDVVHVHRSNALWSDLFKNISFKIDTDKTVTGFINGKKIDNILSRKIEPYESIVIAIGNLEGIYKNRVVPITRIKEVESKKESCGINGI